MKLIAIIALLLSCVSAFVCTDVSKNFNTHIYFLTEPYIRELYKVELSSEPSFLTIDIIGNYAKHTLHNISFTETKTGCIVQIHIDTHMTGGSHQYLRYIGNHVTNNDEYIVRTKVNELTVKNIAETNMTETDNNQNWLIIFSYKSKWTMNRMRNGIANLLYG